MAGGNWNIGCLSDCAAVVPGLQSVAVLTPKDVAVRSGSIAKGFSSSVCSWYHSDRG